MLTNLGVEENVLIRCPLLSSLYKSCFNVKSILSIFDILVLIDEDIYDQFNESAVALYDVLVFKLNK